MLSTYRNTRRPSSAVPTPCHRGLVAALLVTSSLLVACAGTPPVRSDATQDALVYTVMEGDRLGEIARETTGNADHWRAIAAVNGIADPRKLQAGAPLVIPSRLLPAESLALTHRVILATVDVNRRFELTPLDGSRGHEGRSLLTKSVSVGKSVRVKDVAGKADAVVVTRIAATDVTRTGTSSLLEGQRGIRVVGSYFPKGIYAQPASYSRLMMRVAPGTVLPLERTVSDWYEVMTSEGIGYLRDIDGKLADSDDGVQLTLAESDQG